jgi:hypothetical protein
MTNLKKLFAIVAVSLIFVIGVIGCAKKEMQCSAIISQAQR